jgi:hypothetical protein
VTGEYELIRYAASKELRDIWVILLIGTNKLMIVKSALIGKVEFDVTIMFDALILQLTVAVRDEQEMFVPLDKNWLALYSVYDDVIAAALTRLKVRFVD